MASSKKQALLDFQSEMKSRLIDGVFEVHGKKWELKLLNEEEQMWASSMMNTSTVVTTALSGRLANLAIGIRKIDDTAVYEYFSDEWDNLDPKVREELEYMNKYAIKYFVAEHLYSYLAAMPPDFITELWDSWDELIGRREEAQKIGKKSSGETSPQASNES